MEELKNNWFEEVRHYIFEQMAIKNIKLDELCYSLGVTQDEFNENFTNESEDISFYFQTLLNVDTWEREE